MYFKKSELPAYYIGNIHDGNGEILYEEIIPKNNLPEKCQICSFITLEPGQSIGYHEHVDTTELYYLISGEAETIDDSTELTLYPGDMTLTANGQGHYLRNTSKEPCKLFIAAFKA
ncbi:cupin domain-containing protein [Anaerobium acetethylicum]|uniref:Cupin domain-containing protein n=1 Tax=Anaerobium acetethylicum TaxID=1619234 RepID=A0A1D3TW45_9FIRM|nr:cupin domain-containing protein [Anaerobium acetethylicum]SCP98422.1 Cupin domain-containing protein [Anaerobium acetethylicum]